MLNLTFQYPAWYLIFCAVLGLGFALILYYKDNTFLEKHPNYRRILAVLRGLAATLIAVLLMSPLLKSKTTETKKPVIVMAQDQSESISATTDEAKMKIYQTNFENLKSELAKNYEVHDYAFGSEFREKVNFENKDKVTDISAVLKSAYDLYSGQNLGAIILATDGIYNEGTNPLYAAEKLTAPVYTIALGDTTPKKDLLIKKVLVNNIAYLGDKFSMQIDVAAKNSAGSNTTLSVSQISAEGKKIVHQSPINIVGNTFFTTKEIILDADKAGVQKYVISVSQLNGEMTAINNTKEIFIDVVDGRQKILLLANSPHPDLTAIREALTENKNYQIFTEFVGDAAKLKFSDYDLVVLHQLPSKTNDISAVLKQLSERKTARLFVVGSQSDIGKFNMSQSLLNIVGDGRNLNDVQAKIGGEFNLFGVADNMSKEVGNFPPLTAPFGDFKSVGNGQILMYQKIGKIDTKYPLLMLGEQTDGSKIGILSAEGVWKWRLFDFLQHQNASLFDGMIGKTAQYLTVKEDKRKFRVTMSKNVFKENENIDFSAELYNDNYELLNDADVKMLVKDAQKKEFNFTFNKTSNKTYSLNAGFFPAGDYSYKSNVTNAKGEQLVFEGKFSIQAINIELSETTADFSLLRAISQKFGGKTVMPTEISSISELIRNKNNIKPIIYETSKTQNIINYKWIFGLLLLLLGSEWFLRRYWGGY